MSRRETLILVLIALGVGLWLAYHPATGRHLKALDCATPDKPRCITVAS